MRNVYLETFGCQMNKLDSELVAGALVSKGWSLVPNQDDADVILFNTCSVRQHAEDKVTSRLGTLRRRKEREPGLVLGIIGCMAENIREDLFDKVPHLDLICGPGELHMVPALVEQAATEHTQAIALAPKKRGGKPFVDPDTDPLERLDLGRFAARGVREEPFRAYVRVQRGCNHMCAFCIVPYTRGKEIYRPPENVIQEVEGLVDDGAIEVTLLGQNVNSYHWDYDDGRTVGLGHLIRELNKVPGLKRVRFVTSHPADMDDDILRAVGESEHACPYLHMPAQSGSDRVLAAMRRGYTRDFYLKRAERARELIPGVAIAGDFIVGFPGETDADFDQTVALVREAAFKNSFIFKYSPRPGTPAAGAVDDVPADVKRARNRRLLQVQEEVAGELNRGLVGRTFEVLVEGPSKKQAAADAAEVEAASEGACDSSHVGAAIAEVPDGPRALQLDLAPLRRAAARRAEAEAPASAGPTTVQLMGRTTTDHIVVFDGPSDCKGRLMPVRIVDSTPLTLFGRAV